METKEMKIVPPEGYEIDRENSALDCIKFKPKKQFPMKLEEAEMNIARECFGNKWPIHTSNGDLPAVPYGLGKPMLALCQLLVLRNAWWMADGDWRPDYSDGIVKHYVSVYKGQIDKDSVTYCNVILVFRTPEIRDKFYEAFKGIIEEAKELL